MTSSRRALIAVGGAALLAGCGAKKDRGEDRARLLAEQLQAEQAVLGAYAGLRGREVSLLLARARARVNTIEAALRAAGRQPSAHASSGAPSLQRALTAESAALRTHVAATGRTADPALRTLLADLVASTAQAEALLTRMLGRDPLGTAFPGQAL